MNTALSGTRRDSQISLICFLLYLALLAVSIWNHELWEDEIHSWNIAKASGSFNELFRNFRYEGHPPLWYILLWLLSKLTHQAAGIQVLQYFLAAIAMWLLLFRSPFPNAAKILLPFGYFLLYEFGSFSRNYALALVCGFGLLVLLRSKTAKPATYYLLLFLLANTHLLGIILACSIQSYLLFDPLKQSPSRTRWIHAAFGALCILSAFTMIIPPGDSELNTAFWIKVWSKEQLVYIATSGLRSLFPMPTWWEYHFWNTQFIWHWAYSSAIRKLFAYATSLALLLLACSVLKTDLNCLRLFLINVLLTALIGLMLPLSSARYVGFIFIGFLAALWMHPDIQQFSWKKNSAFFLLLLLQIPGAAFALINDGRSVFSQGSEVPKLIELVPQQDSLLTDFYALNPLLAFTERPWYCIEAGREVNCILWTQELTRLALTKDPYRKGAELYFRNHPAVQFYLLSSLSPKPLSVRDSAFVNEFSVRAVDSLTGSLNKYSNLYLYQVTRWN